MSKPRLFVKLYVAYFDSPAIAELSEAAELLCIRALCRAKKLGSGSYLTFEQVEQIVPKSYATTTQLQEVVYELANELVRAGLWSVDGDGFHVGNWLGS